MSTIPRWFNQRKGLAVGIVVAGFGVGALVTPLLTQTLISSYGWRTSFLILGVISWAVIIPLSQLVRRGPAQMNGESIEPCEEAADGMEACYDNEHSLGQAMKTLPFWIYAASHLLWAICNQAIVVHIIPLAIDSGISDMSAAGILSFMIGVSLLGRVSVGLVSDRLGSRRALGLCLLLVMLALWWLLFAQEIWAFLIWAIAFGLADGGKVTSETLVPLDLFGAKSLGVILGVLMFCGTIGGAVGPPLAGYIFDMTSSYDVALMTLAAVATVAAVLGLVLLRYKDHRGRGA
jgi:sugar phosphate permease